jgi:hypothetical protein
MATINIGEIVATCLRHRNKELADNITEHSPLLKMLQQKGNVRICDGGRDIVEEVLYSEVSNGKWYSGSETLDTTPNDIIDAATFDWKQWACTVGINGLEEIKNSGKERIINLIEARIKCAKITANNELASVVFSDGTTANQIGGLKYLVADDPTSASTVGGIPQATYAFWQNKVEVGAAAAATIQGDMTNLWYKTIRNNEKTDLIVGDLTYVSAFEASLQTIQRLTDPRMAKLGFENIMYKSAPVVYDEHAPSGVVTAANARMYFLNTDYIYLRPHKDRNIVPLDDRASFNQDAYIVPVVFAGNLTCSNRARQGVLKPS